MYACISYKLDEVGLTMHYKWAFGSQYQTKGQWSMKYIQFQRTWQCDWAENARYTCAQSDRIYKYGHDIEFTFLVYTIYFL